VNTATTYFAPALVLCMLVAACGQPDPSDSRSKSSAPVELTAVFQGYQLQGDCGGKENPAKFDDNSGITLLPPVAELTKSGSCRLSVDLDIPAGYQMALPLQTWRGVSRHDLDLSVDYRFDGTGDPPASFSHAFPYTGGEGSWIFTDHSTAIWSPSCGSTQRVRLITDVTMQIGADTALLTIDTVDFVTARSHGVAWRRCGEGSPIDDGPAGVGEKCGGALNRSCAAGLACAIQAGHPDTAGDGICVDPNQKTAPQPRGESCGGPANVACQDGLQCTYLTQQSLDAHELGSCEPAVGGKGDRCGGTFVPQLSCASGLYCILNDDSAQWECGTATGELGSQCGSGLPACVSGLSCADAVKRCVATVDKAQTCDDLHVCGDGLRCSGGTCHPTAKPGEPCGGPDDIVCVRAVGVPNPVCQKAQPTDSTGICQ
jgi:hypothetical protein